MSVVLVTSPDTNAGKTAICVALGQRLRRLGKQVAYRRVSGPGADADAKMVASALRQSDSPDSLVHPAEAIAGSLRGEADVVLVEASISSTRTVVAALSTETTISLIVARYVPDDLAQTIVDHATVAGIASAQVIINAVPDKGQRQVDQRVAPALHAAGLTVVGVVPQDRIMLGMTARELAVALDAEVLCGADGLDGPVEAVMVAAMSDEGAEPYFRRLNRKAVVAAGDRPDIHMPALATDTTCIVLTEGRDPDPTVLKTADQQSVPLLKVGPDTTATLDRISDAWSKIRFHQSHKVSRAYALYQSHVAEASLLEALGVTSEVVR